MKLVPGQLRGHQVLNPIPEGSRETDETEGPETNLATYLQAEDPELQAVLQQVLEDREQPVEETPGEEITDDKLQDRLPLSWVTAPLEMVEPLSVGGDDDATHCELAIYPPMTKVISNLSRQPTGNGF